MTLNLFYKIFQIANENIKSLTLSRIVAYAKNNGILIRATITFLFISFNDITSFSCYDLGNDVICVDKDLGKFSDNNSHS